MNIARNRCAALFHSRISCSAIASTATVNSGIAYSTYHPADSNQSPTTIGSRRHSSNSTARSMKFVQFTVGSKNGPQKLGVLSAENDCVTEIAAKLPQDLIALIKSGISLERLAQPDAKGKSYNVKDVKLLAPVSNPQKILCIGLNYRGHCEEQNKPVPKEPMFFSKYASAIVGPYDDVIAHGITEQIDWEVELAVIIGKEAKHVSKTTAMDYVFGYTVAQDISARDWQKTRNGGQFLIGKSMDTFCPLGPAVVHKSLVPDPHNLIIKCSINGTEKQKGNTSELVFRIDDIIERVTQSITLLPGDVILTGTPAGVGMHRNPPEFLRPGDVIESEIKSIGKIVNKVAAD